MPNLRILHCFRAPVGGLFRHVRDLAREQAAQGHAVGLICDATASDQLTARHLTDLEPTLELGISRLPMPREVGIGDVHAVTATRDLASAMRADILHGHGAKGGAYARFAARAMRRRGCDIRCFYTPHGGSLHYARSTLKGAIFLRTEDHLARLTDGIIFESDYARRTYERHVGVPQCATRVVHNGLLPSEFELAPQDASTADFVFVGELRRLKGVDILLAAFAMLDVSRPPRLVIV
ncbi:MAG: glycosyltransferase family 4 protein, partial [Proteobacteria bacterium]|nr:glycosyltransferase family 4 protein [Pseudomonadota bacterium]